MASTALGAYPDRMPSINPALLPALLPKAVEWVEGLQTFALAHGVPLDGAQLRIARLVGVSATTRVRICEVEQLPRPQDPQLSSIATATGMFTPDMVGLTLGHGIYIVRGRLCDRLLAHELRHVAQVEAAGSIGAFLSEYISQVVRFGYWNAPLELDARAHEVFAF